jgi:hypothetical protein
MSKTFKIILLVLIALVVVQSIAVVVVYRRNAELAKGTARVKSQTRSFDQGTIDPKVLDKIHQLDEANVAADVQRFRQQHPEIKNGFRPEGLTEDGMAREFDRAMMSADVPALSKLCKQISEEPLSKVRIKTITDNPKICGITHLEKLGDSKIAVDAGPEWDAIYQYEMTDAKGHPFGVMSYLAVSWSKKSGAWALESAISTGRFFRIEKKP